MIRIDGRSRTQLRPLKLSPDFVAYAEGSVLIEAGGTRVLCTASVEEKVPPFLEGKNQGWVSAEYTMLPRATHTRTARERGTTISGRTREIERLIGRSLRAAVNLTALGPRTITLDCDVLQADGGTRTLSITGAYVALSRACTQLVERGVLSVHPIQIAVAAVSVGVVDGELLLDLCYAEDSRADVDCNVVMTAAHEFIEIQGTAEGRALSRGALGDLLDLAEQGITGLLQVQEPYL